MKESCKVCGCREDGCNGITPPKMSEHFPMCQATGDITFTQLYPLGDKCYADLLAISSSDRKITGWTIAQDLAEITNLGVDEAHDVIQGIIKKRGNKK